MHLSFAPSEVYIYSMASERAFMRRIYREFMEDLREILRGCGFTFKKQYGQNFISDTNLLKSIVSLSGADKNTAAVEIGCGAGTLTRELAAAAKEVVAFEIDAKLQPVLARTLAGVENAEVIFRDFLKADLPALEEKLGEYVVVANLPYYITTPLVMRFVEEAKRVKSLTVMVQDDVARRFCAEAGTPDYGAVTAAIARRAEAKIVKFVPRRMFYPVPNVDSAVVRLDFIENRIPVASAKMYRDTVRAAFLSRRKTLENNLMNAFSLPRERAKAVMAAAAIPEMARGETLAPQKLAELADILYREIGERGQKKN